MNNILIVALLLASCAHSPPSHTVALVPPLSMPSLRISSLPTLRISPALSTAEPALATNEVSCERGKRCVPKYRFSADVDEESTAKAIKWIEAANKSRADELLIEINTHGGSVDAGFELARAIEDSAAPVTCVVDGEAASMGFYVLQSCATRMATPRSVLMAHEPSVSGLVSGQPNKIRGLADSVAASAAALASHCAHRLKITLVEYKQKTDGGKSWYILPDEALTVGAVDEIAASVSVVQKRLK